MKTNKVYALLFDVSPFMYMSYYGALAILKNPVDLNNEYKVGLTASDLLRGKINSCFNLIPENSWVLPIFCYDGVHSTIKKKQVNSNYKEGRVHPLTKTIRCFLVKTFKAFPGFHIINDTEEADDLICSFKHKIKQEFQNPEFYIFSKDNDLLQLCDYRTTFIDPGSNKGVRGRQYLKEKFGLENFKHIILYKVCFGDRSDNIEGIFKGKRHLPIISKFKSCLKFSNFLSLDIFDSEEQKERAKQLFSIIRLKNNLTDYTVHFNCDQEVLDKKFLLEGLDIPFEVTL